MSTEKYVNFISSQVKRERAMGFRAYDNVNEQVESLQEAKLSLKDAKSTLAKHVGISKEFQHTLDDSHEHVGTSKEGHHVFYVHHESTADHDAGHGYTVVHPNGKITDHTVHGEKPDSDGSSDPSKVPNRKDMDNSKHHAGKEVHHLTPSTKDTMHKAAKKNAPDFED